ncbi:MAG: transglutaminase [Phycisphaerae bacterium]|nr:transglutaminase [Phycisphaerae bacterium]
MPSTLAFMNLFVFLLAALNVQGLATDPDLERALRSAGDNRGALVAALDQVPPEQIPGMSWLIRHMPLDDLRSLTTAYLVENVNESYESLNAAIWKDSIPKAVFYDAILPYASINERRDQWRADFRSRFGALVKDAKSSSEAAAILNNSIFKMLNVHYSTDRPKPDQSPYESIEAGMASCTGLSILLVNACRSVGVPARFVGVPKWSDDSGNHSWVEIYDDGQWHFTGAAEPVGMSLDKAWFESRARGAIENHEQKAILAVTWRRVPLTFPLPWKPGDDTVGAVDVTSRYTNEAQALPEGMVRIRVLVRDAAGNRVSRGVTVRSSSGRVIGEGRSRDDRFDSNDHLEFTVPSGERCHLEVMGSTPVQVNALQDEQLVEIKLSADSVTPEGR